MHYRQPGEDKKEKKDRKEKKERKKKEKDDDEGEWKLVTDGAPMVKVCSIT